MAAKRSELEAAAVHEHQHLAGVDARGVEPVGRHLSAVSTSQVQRGPAEPGRAGWCRARSVAVRGCRSPGWRCSDPDWQAASQALDDPMGKLLVIRRLPEADEHLPKRQPRAAPT